jgi:VanZ family protein
MLDGLKHGPVRRSFVRGVWLWAPVLVYMSAIFHVSSLSEVAIPGGVSDRSGHTVAYLLLAILVVRAVAGGLPARVGRRTATLALLITVGYGLSDEIHQMFVPGRYAELMDVFANTVGSVLGVALCWLWGILAHRRRASLGED